MLDLLKRFTGPYGRYFILGPLCKLVEVGFDLCTPLVVALMIDRGVGARDACAVVLYGALLVGMAFVGFAFTFACQKMSSRASQGMGTSLRDALFEHVNRLSYAELDRFGTPTLITRITGDVNQVQLAVALGIRQLVRFPLLAVGSMMAALAIDLELGLIFLVATPLIGGVFWFVMSRCVPYFKLMQNKLDRIALVVREGLTGARVVRAFVREDHERARAHRAAGEQAAVAIAVGKLSSVLNPATFLIMNLAVCAILWVGGFEVSAGSLSQGQVMAFVNYMTQTLLAIVYVANLVVVFTKASASASRIVEVLDCAPSITDPQAGDERPQAGGGAASPTLGEPAASEMTSAATCALRMMDVSFAYPGAGGAALRGVTLELPMGGTLGVIGGTGSGKSTLVNLIPRLYDASEGRVEVLGRDVRAWQLDDLRRAIGLVPQKAQLVSGAIRTNLQWRDPQATDDELWDALEVAQAADFVRALPSGLGAPVESGGKNFSGGQRQRLTIARALVGEPQILILDDSASALDFKTDAALRSALRTRQRSVLHARQRELFPRFEGKNNSKVQENLPLATVVVSQRVSSVRDADLICALYHGEVAGLGTHDELLGSCSIYREIAESQGACDDSAAAPAAVAPVSAPAAPATPVEGEVSNRG